MQLSQGKHCVENIILEMFNPSYGENVTQQWNNPSSYRVIETLVRVWENSKKLWKHSPAARVPTSFLVLPNFHSCLYNSIETRYMFSIS